MEVMISGDVKDASIGSDFPKIAECIKERVIEVKD